MSRSRVVVRGPERVDADACIVQMGAGRRFHRPGIVAPTDREAMASVLRHAFRKLRLQRVEAGVQPGDAASLALVQRAGFRREGFSPRYSKVAGRWRDARALGDHGGGLARTKPLAS